MFSAFEWVKLARVHDQFVLGRTRVKTGVFYL
jgi:hypothetical protein